LDGVGDDLDSHQDLIGNLDLTVDDYGKPLVRTADRKKAGNGLATLGELYMVREQNIATLSGAAWNINAVALNQSNPAYI